MHRPLKNGKAHKHSFLLNKFICCGHCSYSVGGQLQKGNTYYRCSHYDTSCPQRACPLEENLEDQVISYLRSLKIKNKRLLHWVRKALKESHETKNGYHKEAVGHLQAEVTKIDDRLEKLYDDKLDGVIDADFYDRKRKQYTDKQQVVASKLKQHQKANVNYYDIGSAIFELAQQGDKLYQDAKKIEDKRALLSIVFAQLSLKDGKLTPKYHNGFQLIADCALSKASSKVSGWLPLLDSLRTTWVQDIRELECDLHSLKDILSPFTNPRTFA